MDGLNWAHQVAHAMIARSTVEVDGLGTKAGLIFAYGEELR